MKTKKITLKITLKKTKKLKIKNVKLKRLQKKAQSITKKEMKKAFKNATKIKDSTYRRIDVLASKKITTLIEEVVKEIEYCHDKLPL